MDEFLWIDWNLQKIDAHNLASEEVEFAWRGRRDLRKGTHPIHGDYTESAGRCPSGRVISIVWRYNEGDDGVPVVFVITAYGGGK